MLITVRVHPRAARAKTSWTGAGLEVWVTAPPIGGAANTAVLKAVASHLNVPMSAVTLRSGGRARTKLVEVREGGGQ